MNLRQNNNLALGSDLSYYGQFFWIKIAFFDSIKEHQPASYLDIGNFQKLETSKMFFFCFF